MVSQEDHTCVVFTSWVPFGICAQLDIGEYLAWFPLDMISPTRIVGGDRLKAQKLLSIVASLDLEEGRTSGLIGRR